MPPDVGLVGEADNELHFSHGTLLGILGESLQEGPDHEKHRAFLASPRALTEQEFERFTSKHGHEPTGFVIAYGALALYGSRENAINSLTLEQIDGIFSSTHKRGMTDMRTWGQVGLAGTWADASIHLYGPHDRSSGTRSFFKEAVLLNGNFKRSLKTEPGLACVIVAVGKDRYGIGYSHIGLETSAVRAVPVNGKSGRTAVHRLLHQSCPESIRLAVRSTCTSISIRPKTGIRLLYSASLSSRCLRLLNNTHLKLIFTFS